MEMLRTNSPYWLAGNGSSMRGDDGFISNNSIQKKDPGMDLKDHDRQAKAKSVFAPRPRRVTSPELIFRGSSLDRCEKEELCSLQEEIFTDCMDSEDDSMDKWHFRPIERPDVELTSLPTRSGNPVIMDERFHAIHSTNYSSPTLHRPIALSRKTNGTSNGPEFTRWSTSC